MAQLNLLLSGVLFGGVYALFAVGLSLLLGVMRVFNIAYGAVFTVAALSTVKVAEQTGWSWIPLVLVGAGIGAVLGVVIEILAVRPFRRLHLRQEDMEHGTLIATLALLIATNALTTHYTAAQYLSYPVGTFPTGVVSLVGDFGFGVMYYINFAISLGLLVALAAIIKWTQRGRAIRAIASDYRAARLLGINVVAFSIGISALSGAFAGTAGVLLGMTFNAVAWDFGDTFLFTGFVIVVLGGAGSVVGTLVAGIALSTVISFTAYYAGGNWSEAVAFVLLMLFLAVRPSGIFGRSEIVRA